MKKKYITEEEMECYGNPSFVVKEATVPYKSNSFEEEVEKHKCITLEEFGRMWKDSIDNDTRFS